MSGREKSVSVIVKVALSLVVSVAFFATVELVSAVNDHRVLVVALGMVCTVAVFAVARWWGIAYAVPAAIASLLAFDWFYIPPTHDSAVPDTANALAIAGYLAVGVLVGQLAARAWRSADVSEGARSVLADEQASLRRVATLVAHGVSQDELLAAVALEAGKLPGVHLVGIGRYDTRESVTLVASWGDPLLTEPVGKRWPLGPDAPTATSVFRTGRPARFDLATDETYQGAVVDERVVRSGVGCPIVVEGRMWGLLFVTSPSALPADTEERLTNFTELVATAIANADARAEVSRLAEEQAALRRVATLVAEGVAPADVFAAVAAEVGLLLRVDGTAIVGGEVNRTPTVVAVWGDALEGTLIGTPVSLDDDKIVSSVVLRTGRAARCDTTEDETGYYREHGICWVAGSPIVVEGRTWGAMLAASTQPEPPAPGTEARIGEFTQLLATAVSNAKARSDVSRLAEEQAALRRIATLVARGVPSSEIFAAVAEELARMFDADVGWIARYGPDSTMTVLASWSRLPTQLTDGSQWSLDGDSVVRRVYVTGRRAHMDDDEYARAAGTVAARSRAAGMRSSVGAPIVVDDRLWGVAAVSSTVADRFPSESEDRMADFSELVATAISNAETRAELTASRARVVAAADDARQRLERNLHDGIQQRLVALSLELRGAEELAPPELHSDLARIGAGLGESLDELREIARGIHPAILSEGGLVPALKTLARRSPVAVALYVRVEARLHERIEVAAYYVASEALANAAKHAHASEVDVHLEASNGKLNLLIRDDGVGGADPARGSGLIGIGDRVAAVGGTLSVASPPGEGTALQVTLPV